MSSETRPNQSINYKEIRRKYHANKVPNKESIEIIFNEKKSRITKKRQVIFLFSVHR